MSIQITRDAGAICILCLTCLFVSSAVVAGEASSKDTAVSEQTASRCLGKEVKQTELSEDIMLPLDEEELGSLQNAKTGSIKSFLERHSISIFQAGTEYYAFTADRHLLIASHWGGSMQGARVVDLNEDGRDDLIVEYQLGSGMVRPDSTVMIDAKDGLRVFRVHGVPEKKAGKWYVAHPLSVYGFGKGKSLAILRFGDDGITIAWPKGTKEGEKWSMGQPGVIVTEINWSPNEQVHGTADRRP